MKLLFDFIPLIFFFTFFKLYDIYAGVLALMITSTIAITLTWFIYKKVDKIALLSYAMIMIFGCLTLFFQSDLFIKWKVTIIYLIFAAILIGSHFFLSEPAIKKLFGKELRVHDNIWTRINFSWAIFFILCAVVNLYVAYCFSQATWVDYKTFVLPGVTLVFTIISGVYLYKHHKPESDDTQQQK